MSKQPSLPPDPRLEALLDTLELLLEEARAYELSIPSSNLQGYTAVTRLRDLAQKAFNEAGDLLSAPEAPENPLSRRQFEVLGLISKGLTNKEIAYRLGLSERTVEFHLNAVFNKTGTFTRTEAVAYAFRNGWL